MSKNAVLIANALVDAKRAEYMKKILDDERSITTRKVKENREIVRCKIDLPEKLPEVPEMERADIYAHAYSKSRFVQRMHFRQLCILRDNAKEMMDIDEEMMKFVEELHKRSKSQRARANRRMVADCSALLREQLNDTS